MIFSSVVLGLLGTAWSAKNDSPGNYLHFFFLRDTGPFWVYSDNGWARQQSVTGVKIYVEARGVLCCRILTIISGFA